MLFRSLSRNLPAESHGAQGSIFALSYLELGLLLPRAALLVHHGGIGTTARALEAAVPQIISPQDFDQPDNGDRVSRLRAGALLPRAQLTGEALAQAAARLLQSVETRAVLQELQLRLRASNAIAAAADVLEQRFGSAAAQARSAA